MKLVKRKKLILGLLITVAIVLGYLSLYLSYVFLIAGFAAAHIGGGKHAGLPGRVRSLTLSWHNYRLHIHHWLVAFLIGLICALKGVYVITPEVFYGFLGGLIVQGIYFYDDWHRIIIRLRPVKVTS
jgi:hypothetical protein